MPRPRSLKTSEVKVKLLSRLRDGLHRPGDRFLSNRAIANKYGISYQTAHRLVTELAREGHLVRRSASGTYVPGRKVLFDAVQLLFHPRAAREGSFGARLLHELTTKLDRERVRHRVTLFDPQRTTLSDKTFPVLWECPAMLKRCVESQRPTLLLNDRPPSGIASVSVDSVSTDDFSGGVCAAQILSRHATRTPKFAILSGPTSDPRSAARVSGFLSVLSAEVVSAGGWYLEDGLKVASKAVAKGASGVFCCNDRLAEAVLLYCEGKRCVAPPLVGFDDAPIAEQLNLTTIAIPWDELATGAIAVIKRRLSGDAATASQQIFAPRPVLRD